MKNRTEEYWELVGELAQPPKQLEGSVQRARKRARRERLLRRLAAPVGTLAAAAACFVLMVNAFPTFALACSAIPIVRELTAAVAFSPSLSAAVAHDYVQYIGQSQTVDGVTVRLEYAILDQAKAVFFYTADGVRLHTTPDLTGEDGEYLPGGYGVSYSQSKDKDVLSSVTFDFVREDSLPGRLTMEMYFIPEETPDYATAAVPTAAPGASLDDYDPEEYRDPREDPGVLRFTFNVTLDLNHIAEPIVIPVDRWVALDGQRILVDSLEYTPTRTVLRLGEDPANTAWLRSLKFWFEDEKGRRYDDIDGTLSASGSEDTGSKSFLTYYFQSFYYDPPEGLTLCVDKAEWLDKEASTVTLDLNTGECSGLPQGTEIGEIVRTGDNVRVEVCSPLSRKGFAQTFTSAYRDPEGGEHYWNRSSYTSREEGPNPGFTETLFLDDYPWDTVELELSYTSVSEYQQPVYVPLTPQS